MILAIDFDGTIAEHRYPDIGDPIPKVFEYLIQLQEAGAKLILWTMRHDSPSEGPVLTDAVEFCRANGVEFWGVNENPEQSAWTNSPKVYAHVYVDDAAFGCPLKHADSQHRAYVDWDVVGPILLEKVKQYFDSIKWLI